MNFGAVLEETYNVQIPPAFAEYQKENCFVMADKMDDDGYTKEEIADALNKQFNEFTLRFPWSTIKVEV